MEFLLVLLIIIIIVGFGFISYLLLRRKEDSGLFEVMNMIQSGSRADREALNTRLDSATAVISALQRNVGEMSEIGKSMRDLQEFLLSPKLRGNIGEQVLRELLGQMLPKNSFHLQYRFASGEKVDAAIQTSGGLIPIDSKFPMDNFRKMLSGNSVEEKKSAGVQFVKDIRMHINSISSKYINTAEGTIDYALMYVPSEAVYYEVVNNQDLYDYAASKRVLPVSPTTFYAYLRAILMSFEGQKIEEQAKEILSALQSIQKDYTKAEDNILVLQKHLTNASNMMNTTMRSFSDLGHRLKSTKNLSLKDSPKKRI